MLSDIREYNKLSAPGNCSSEVVEGLLPNYKRSRIAISIEVFNLIRQKIHPTTLKFQVSRTMMHNN